MILPLLGYNGEDEEDDTTDSDGKCPLNEFINELEVKLHFDSL